MIWTSQGFDFLIPQGLRGLKYKQFKDKWRRFSTNWIMVELERTFWNLFQKINYFEIVVDKRMTGRKATNSLSFTREKTKFIIYPLPTSCPRKIQKILIAKKSPKLGVTCYTESIFFSCTDDVVKSVSFWISPTCYIFGYHIVAYHEAICFLWLTSIVRFTVRSSK